MADIYIRIRARFLRLQHAGSSARMSLAALPCGGGCTGAHWAEGVAPRSHMSAPAPSEPARGRPQLTACWLLCGRSSPPPLCSPSRRRPWSRPRRRLGRTCRWRLSAPRPLHVLAASSLIAHPLLPPTCRQLPGAGAETGGKAWDPMGISEMCPYGSTQYEWMRTAEVRGELPCNPRSLSAQALRLRAPSGRSSTGGCAWRRRLASSSRSPDSTSAATCPRRQRSHSSR